MKCTSLLVLLGGAVAIGTPWAQSADWPMWRHDANRTANSDEALPRQLAVSWVRSYSPRVQVWDDPFNHDLMTYDRVFEPIVLGDRMFIGFNDCDKLVAFDIHTGREEWSFYTDGPVRLAPVGWRDNVYFASDDGHLYCVRAADGALQWKYRGGPSDRKALGNRRVISAWPVRGGPVIREGTIYFAASIWPFMGTFIHALDAVTGKIVWVNDGTGAQYIKQPHNAPAFAGVAPQGSLVATEKYLVVPGGRSVPAVFDRKTGAFLYYHLADGGKGTGGSFVAATEAEFYVHTRGRGVQAFDLPTGKKGELTTTEPVLGPGGMFIAQDSPAAAAKLRRAEEKLPSAEYAVKRARSRLFVAEDGGDAAAIAKAKAASLEAEKALELAQAALETEKRAQESGYTGAVVLGMSGIGTRWELPVPSAGDIIRAGDRLYVGGANQVSAIELPTAGGAPKLAWSRAVDGHVMRLLAANGHLFAVTLEGRIYGLGQTKGPPAVAPSAPVVLAPGAESRRLAQEIVAAAGTLEGYALCYGLGDSALVDALLAESRLHITVVDTDVRRVESARRRFDAAGLYGTRVSVHHGNPRSFQAPPYIANVVVVSEDMAREVAEPRQLAAAYESVRPYGGVLWMAGRAGGQLAAHVASAQLPKAKIQDAHGGLLVVREGALPGAADWTHQYGNVANTVKSDDRIVRAPLGVLWFGGVPNADVLPRHGHGPSEQVVGGRLFIEGMDCISARDVYTGRVLWKTQVPGLDTYGVYWDETYLDVPITTLYSQVHIPGANARGANYVATEDAVYVATRHECQVLDSRTGRVVKTIRMPVRPGETQPPEWGFLGVYGDTLLGGAGFAHYGRKFGASSSRQTPAPPDLSASEGLVGFDRRTGEVRWRVEARHSFWHNGIVAGRGLVYCLDRLPQSVEDRLRRRGTKPPGDYRIAAFDIRDGRLRWETTRDIFGTWLGYSEIHDRLLQAGANATDRLKDEAAKGMITYRGADGTVAWQNLELAYTGPCILHNDLIVTTANSYANSSGAFSLLDGRPHLVPNPLTGKLEPWKVHRTYGCNYIVASENLLTFRAGAAGFYDLENHTGTGSLGGFKSGCSPNLIVANGVLNAPDYTRTCSCAYQNQTSLAFIHMPELEMWTYNLFGAGADRPEPIRRLGLNLGAPGDRRSDAGTLWLEYPFVAGASPNIEVKLNPARPDFFVRHASQMAGDGPAWVVGSGARGIASIAVTPRLDKPVPVADSRVAPAPAMQRVAAAPAMPQAAPAPAPGIFTVRLYFAEPDNLAPAQRVFDVLVQGRPVLTGFDVAQEAGGALRGVVREFRDVRVEQQLMVEFRRRDGSAHPPVLSGIELIAESAREVTQ